MGTHLVDHLALGAELLHHLHLGLPRPHHLHLPAARLLPQPLLHDLGHQLRRAALQGIVL